MQSDAEPAVAAVEPQSFDRVLSSMCTDPHPAARQAAIRFLSTNPGDPHTYPGIASLESRAVAALGAVTGLSDPHGYVAGGGTEANVQAVRAARELAEAENPNVVAPKSAHFSFRKAAAILDVELRLSPLTADRRADVSALANLIDDETILVVGVAGTTEYGRVDPIPAIADVAQDADVFCHVDAAWGGFVLPFTDHAWNFADAPIDSMTIDPHKMGRAPIPAGGFLARDRTFLDALAIETPYLESRAQVSLAGTRSGAGVAGTVAAMEALWPDGYEAQYRRASANVAWLATALAERGYDVVEPELPIVAASIDDRPFEALREAGWRISRTEAGELRVVCMPHVTREMLEAFVADLDRLG